MSSMRKAAVGGLVYLDRGRAYVPVCRQPLSACTCRAGPQAVPAGDGVVRVSRETKGRGGKPWTLVRGLRLDAVALAAAGKQLRTRLRLGRYIKDDVVEVQGDHVERVIELLTIRATRSNGQAAEADAPCRCDRSSLPEQQPMHPQDCRQGAVTRRR